MVLSHIPSPITTYTQQAQLEKEFLHCLQQRRIDEKFHYIGERQANAWFNLCESTKYTYYRNSKKLLEENVTEFLVGHTGDVNVIVLGPGDARKEKIVVDSLRENHRVNLFFVDLSREILNVAIKNTEDSGVLKEVFFADLKNFIHIKEISQRVKKYYNPTNFFTFLGNTIGNYPQAIMLKTLRNAMTPGDKILIDVHARSGESVEEQAIQIDKMIESYDSNPAIRERIPASFFEIGIEATDGIIEIEYGKDDFFPKIGAIKYFFCFTRNKIITYRGTDVYFAKGERILVHYSNKYTFDSLEQRNIFTSHGLRITKHVKDAVEKCYLLLCELA